MDTRIKSVMASVFQLSPDQIPDNASPKILPQWDSLKHLNLIVGLEQEFGIQFDELEILDLATLDALREAIHTKVNH